MRFLIRALVVATSLAVYVLGFKFKYANSNSNSKTSMQLQAVPEKSLLIWDCDGVLVDSEALLKQGEVEALAAAGFDLSIDDCVRLFSGVSPDQASANFLMEFGQPIPQDFFKDQITGSMDLFRRRLVPLMYDTVRGVHEGGLRQCIASGSPRPRVDLCVEVSKMQPFFTQDAVFTRELVARGKPAPDLFLYTAKQMGNTPSEQCLVIEDSVSGIQAAIAAGMEVLGYLGGGHAQAEWYRKAVYDFNIPVVHTEREVLEYIQKKML